jgi:glycosyltransferase involved in cell wall biosynthesis
MGFREADFERVHFLDFVPFEQLAHLYTLATLLVVPPYYEGFGFALMGAMASGCPAVVSTNGACPEVVGDTALLADPDSPADFAAKIERLLSDEPLRRELRRKALARAATWTWEKTARLTLEGLTRAVRRP